MIPQRLGDMRTCYRAEQPFKPEKLVCADDSPRRVFCSGGTVRVLRVVTMVRPTSHVLYSFSKRSFILQMLMNVRVEQRPHVISSPWRWRCERVIAANPCLADQRVYTLALTAKRLTAKRLSYSKCNQASQEENSETSRKPGLLRQEGLKRELAKA